MVHVAATPIYVKNSQNLLQNRKYDDLETLHGVYRGCKPYKIYINDDPGLTLTYFIVRSSLDDYCVHMGENC